jgi:hypothetical protein
LDSWLDWLVVEDPDAQYFGDIINPNPVLKDHKESRDQDI